MGARPLHRQPRRLAESVGADLPVESDDDSASISTAGTMTSWSGDTCYSTPRT